MLLLGLTGLNYPYFNRALNLGIAGLTHFDDKILTLYAKDMSTPNIVETFRELYGADISPTLVSTVTEAVLGKVIEYPRA